MRHLANILGIAALVGLFALSACTDDDIVNVGPLTPEDSARLSVHYKGVIGNYKRPAQTRVVDMAKRKLKINTKSYFKQADVQPTWLDTRHPVDSLSNWKNMVTRRMTVMINGTPYGNFYVSKDGDISAAVGPFVFDVGSGPKPETFAWYPGNGNKVLDTFSVERNQSYFSKLEKSDLMFGRQLASDSNTLEFTHKMAQLEMHIKVFRSYVNGDELDTIPSHINSVKIANAKTSGSVDITNFSYAGGGMIPDTNSIDTIICYHYADSDRYIIESGDTIDTVFCYKGIIFPQDTMLTLIFDISGKLYEGVIEDYTYEDGILYNINVNLTDEVLFRVGDYLYCNSTGDIVCDNLTLIEDYLADGYRPIGLIFSTTPCKEDQARGWTNGYAMSLTCGDGRIMYHTWGNYQVTQYGSDWATAIKYYNGYDETHHVTDNPAYSSGTHPAYFYAINYASRFSPTTGPQQFYYPTIGGVGHTSGWYLPSIGQWWLILTNLGKPDHTNMTYDGGAAFYWNGQRNTVRKNINAYMTAVDPYTDVTYITNQTCQASNECNSDYGISVIFHDNGHMYPYHWGGRKPYEGYSVWPVIAF